MTKRPRSTCGTSRPRVQIPTVRVSTAEIVRSRAFGVGVSEVRTGLPPRFDEMSTHDWNYERGRLWAVLAPRNMDPHSVKAIRLYEAASRRRLIP